MSMLYINLTCPGVANENEKYDFFFHFMIYVLFKSVVLFDVFCYIIVYFYFPIVSLQCVTFHMCVSIRHTRPFPPVSDKVSPR